MCYYNKIKYDYLISVLIEGWHGNSMTKSCLNIKVTSTLNNLVPYNSHCILLYLSNGLFFFERCSLITATMCANKFS